MQRYLVALALAGVVDALSFMIVAPSLIFYVVECNGTKEQYGIILSGFSFASFCTKPLLGWWSDRRGFRGPYLSSLAIAALGGMLYLLASTLFHSGWSAVSAILISRLLGGIGAANAAIGYAYIAKVVPHREQTTTNTLLSAVRMVGLAAAPGINAFLGGIDADVAGGLLRLGPFNSVGLVLVATNLFAMGAIWFLLDEPHDVANSVGGGTERTENAGIVEKETNEGMDGVLRDTKDNTTSFVRAVFAADILVPFLSIFTFNANFQLIETGFPPAANDGIGWGPVETSIALGSLSVVIMVMMLAVSLLSSKAKVSDVALLVSGHALSGVAYAFLFLSWRRGAEAWHFWLPLIASSSAFPLMAAPTRSFFTVSVDSKQVLKGYQGRMQAYLSMGASVAGFVTPGLVAKFCLRTPEEVEHSKDGRELTPLSLFAPLLSTITILGMAYIHATRTFVNKNKITEGQTDEENDVTMCVQSKNVPADSIVTTEASSLL